MSTFNLEGVSVIGLSACVPKQTAHNNEHPFQSEQEKELFIRNTGIRSRRIVPENVTASDLCFHAAEALLAEAGIKREEIGLLVFVTQTPDFHIPSNAPHLQHRLGLPSTTIAFDVNQGCAGYVYGLSITASLLRNLNSSYALMLVGDVSSRCLSPNDRSVAPLFSDAGSATLLKIDPLATPMYFHLGSDGSGFDSIIIPAGGARMPITPKKLEPKELEPGIIRADNHLRMKGIEVLNFSVKQVPPSVRALLEHADWSTEAVDHFVFHQANMLLNEAIRRKLNIPSEKVPYSIGEFGNTSSATIPITLVTQLAEALRSKRNKLVLSGFGVGLSWGTAGIETSGLKVPPLVEIS
jgi:3-oxoacyl-[acyl-carrier-protein] synthase III